MQETQETQVQSLGQEDSLAKEMATHFSIFAWKIPRTEEPSGLQSTGLQRVRHNWGHLHTIMCQAGMLGTEDTVKIQCLASLNWQSEGTKQITPISMYVYSRVARKEKNRAMRTNTMEIQFRLRKGEITASFLRFYNLSFGKK